MRLRRSALSFLLLTGLCLGSLSPARAADGDPTPPDGAARRLAGDARPSLAETVSRSLTAARGTTAPSAQDELAEVQDIFRPKTGAERERALAEAPDATMALRDLTLAQQAAGAPAGRNPAYAMEQRPWDDGQYRTKCSAAANVCVHWISKTTSPNDGDAARDSWATGTVLPTLEHVVDTYAKAGYRPARSDGPRPDGQPMYGGNEMTDIYLADLGASTLYGYCTVDVDDNGHFVYRPTNAGSTDWPAFCVLDNDFSADQFGTRNTPKENLQVTAAHEFYHAVQFGYDYLEDRWFMEATATWSEEQVYDPVNDNVQYLRASQLRHPAASLDDNRALGGMLHYGDWIYFQYLTERYRALAGSMPSLVLEMWRRADSVDGPDLYSLRSVVRTLSAHGASFGTVFGRYAAGNRRPGRTYAEGRVNRYPTAAPQRTAVLRPTARQASGRVTVDHLASATVRFVPRLLARRTTRLRLNVDMANRASGSVAVVSVYLRTGRITTQNVRLDLRGNGSLRVPFGSRRVKAVELTLANASTRLRSCSPDPEGFSCGGVPVDDGKVERYAVRVR